MSKENDWTAKDNAELTALWATGLSAARIGVEMKRSKNSIISKAHRLNFASRQSPIKATADGIRKAPPIRRASKTILPPMPPNPVVPYYARGRSELTAQETENLHVAKAAAATQRAIDVVTAAERPVPDTVFRNGPATKCQFPLWSNRERPTHLYCGEVTNHVTGLCTTHHALCHVPVRPMSLPSLRNG